MSDLSPLKDMKLTYLDCGYTKVSDLSPLKGMKLTSLYCMAHTVSDLSPLKDMKLTPVTRRHAGVRPVAAEGHEADGPACTNAQVADLSPLKGMPLKLLTCDFKPERDAEILRSIKTLETINGKPAEEFWKDVDAKKP